MKVLVATTLTQGIDDDDNHYCVEGELVWIQEPCDRDKNDPDGPCGCGRGFAGAASHRATTTAMVVESEMTRHDMVLAFETSLPDGGWPLEWAEEVAGDNMEIAAQLPVGSIIGRKLEQFFLRGSLLRAPSPEQR
jgi:hypothetical protein